MTNYVNDKPVMRATPMGEGMIDYDTFVGALKEIGYQASLFTKCARCLKAEVYIKNLDDTARKFLEHVKKYQ